MAPKTSVGKGRKKIVIQRIEKEEARQVCFSKRRRGLFNKASELAVLTGAQVAAIAFSPGGKAFSFGHSAVDVVVNRFLAGGEGSADDNKLQNLCQEISELHTELAEQKEQKERMEEAMAKERAAGNRIAAWVEADVRGIVDMGEEDLAAFTVGLMQVQAAISEHANQILMEAFHVDINNKVQVPMSPPHQLFLGNTFQFGSSNNNIANTGMEMQMAMPPSPGFAPWMHMIMPSPQGFATGTEMHHMVMEMPQPLEFLYATYGDGDATYGDGVQQGFGPNVSFPY